MLFHIEFGRHQKKLLRTTTSTSSRTALRAPDGIKTVIGDRENLRNVSGRALDADGELDIRSLLEREIEALGDVAALALGLRLRRRDR